jgi:hypothetical protein
LLSDRGPVLGAIAEIEVLGYPPLPKAVVRPLINDPRPVSRDEVIKTAKHAR